jgi:uncharacterized membrane protein YjgN (DUF898 family)
MKNHSTLLFKGDNRTFYFTFIVNILLTIVSLGFYYPWAKARIFKYLYSSTEFQGSRFLFEGTGKELFRGYIKVVGFFAFFYAAYIIFTYNDLLMYATLVYLVAYLIAFIIYPIIIHSVLRYRTSRSSWRGIYFKYTGTIGGLYKIYGWGLLWSILSFGIYIPWFMCKLHSYIYSHLHFGNLTFRFKGDGGELLGINILGMFLSYITLFIYLPFFLINRLNFRIENSYIVQNKVEHRLKSTAKGGEYFGLQIVNFFIIIFTLGFGMPIVLLRNLKFNMHNIQIPNTLDFENIEQIEQDNINATGEDFADAFDLSIF